MSFVDMPFKKALGRLGGVPRVGQVRNFFERFLPVVLKK
jgi:hypothetical protein